MAGSAAQKTESEKLLLLDGSSDSDDESKAKKVSSGRRSGDNSASSAVAASQYEEYEPLTRLKRMLKDRIAELAKLNSESTVKLVETYLSDGDF